jgi:hypothetical protein
LRQLVPSPYVPQYPFFKNPPLSAFIRLYPPLSAFIRLYAPLSAFTRRYPPAASSQAVRTRTTGSRYLPITDNSTRRNPPVILHSNTQYSLRQAIIAQIRTFKIKGRDTLA